MKYIFTIVYTILTLASQAQNNWSSETALPTTTERRYKAVSFGIGNKGYLGTGERGSFGNQGYREFKDFWEYDTVTKTWSQKADVGNSSTTSRYNAVSFSIGNKGYIGTGIHLSPSSGLVTLQDFWEYDPSTNTWTRKADFLGGPRYSAVAFTIGNTGYVGTGISASSGYSNDFFSYDAATDTWNQKANFGGVERTQATGFGSCGKGYLGTGWNNTGDGLQDFWEYDPASNQWSQIANYGGGNTYDALSMSICNNGYVMKGNCNSNQFWKYESEINEWMMMANFPGTPRFEATSFSANGKGYVGTGFNCDNTYFQDLFSYNPSSQEPPDQPSPITGPTISCQNATHSYSIEPINCATKYTWTIPANALLISGQGTNSIQVRFGNTPGAIVVTASNNCATSMQQSLSITVNPLPTVIANDPPPICAGTSVLLQASGATTYSWTPSTGLNNPEIANPTAAPEQTTTYMVIGTTNLCSDTASVTVIVKPNPIVTAQGSGNICAGDTASLQAFGAVSYSWSPITCLSQPASQNSLAFPMQSTQYIVTGTTNGCSDTAIINLNVTPTPSTPDSILGDRNICENEPVTFSIPDDPIATNYVWMLPSNWFSPDTTNPIINAIPGESGTISVQVFNGSCASENVSAYITVESPPDPLTNISGETTGCNGDNQLYFVNNLGSNISYTWFLPNDSIVFTVMNSLSIPLNMSGEISVTAENQCGHTDTVSAYVTVFNGIPEMPSINQPIPTVCGESFSLALKSQNDVTSYHWEFPEGLTGKSQSNEITVTVSDSSENIIVGDILVFAINDCGISAGLNIPITVVDLDSTITNLETYLVANEDSPGTTYQWFQCPGQINIPDSINSMLTPSISGLYGVQISNQGCTVYSKCEEVIVTSIQSEIGNQNITVFPNPTTGYALVKSIEAEIHETVLYNSTGQKFSIFNNLPNKQIEIDLAQYPSGIYTLIIRAGDYWSIQKLVKI